MAKKNDNLKDTGPQPTDTEEGIKIPEETLGDGISSCPDSSRRQQKSVVETPLMRQYFKMKKLHPDAILLFRVGDFYETFVEDAIETARILGITLTKRANGAASHIELAGFPYHALDTYLPRLVRAGKRVAICEQMEDPKKAIGSVVKRDIIEVVTPGIALTENILENKENNFVASIYVSPRGDLYGIAFLDISTGQFYAGEGNASFLSKMLSAYTPKEVIIDKDFQEQLSRAFNLQCFIFGAEDWYFHEKNNRSRLLRHFNVQSLKGFGLEDFPLASTAAGAILNYLDITRHARISHITSLRRIEAGQFVRLDNFTIYSLELIEPMNRGGRTLCNILDKTLSPMGGRLLRRWILMPLKDAKAIQERQHIVKAFLTSATLRTTLSDKAKGLPAVGDLERTISRIAMRRATPSQVVNLIYSLEAFIPLKRACLESDIKELRDIGQRIALCEELLQRLKYELHPDAPAIIGKGKTIADGYDEELDELRALSRDGQRYLLDLQQREAERTGISSLKVGFNNVFGYYLEVRNTHKKLVPPEWIRKQTLVSAERYITEELKTYENKILGAEERIDTIERTLFDELISYIADFIPAIQQNSQLIAQLDVLYSFAIAAESYHYCCPTVNDGYSIDIVEGRHPVIELQLREGDPYIANNVNLDNDDCQIIIITGPNMSGKSAFLRQTALITLMAQIGSFVPAKQATIGVVDAIFTRVGASDNISMGESTFMVEMQEAANILNNLTERSLILFDEIGRGTGTFDGVSIAWAIVEYLHNHPHIHPKTLFATHYHELNELTNVLNRVQNFNVSAQEINGEMVFLRKLEPGGSEQSFGIQVAKIAGMPALVVNRAKQILEALEKERMSESLMGSSIPQIKGARKKGQSSPSPGVQLSLFDISDPALLAIRDELMATDIDTLRPLEALNVLDRLKAILNKY